MKQQLFLVRHTTEQVVLAENEDAAAASVHRRGETYLQPLRYFPMGRKSNPLFQTQDDPIKQLRQFLMEGCAPAFLFPPHVGIILRQLGPCPLVAGTAMLSKGHLRLQTVFKSYGGADIDLFVPNHSLNQSDWVTLSDMGDTQTAALNCGRAQQLTERDKFDLETSFGVEFCDAEIKLTVPLSGLVRGIIDLAQACVAAEMRIMKPIFSPAAVAELQAACEGYRATIANRDAEIEQLKKELNAANDFAAHLVDRAAD